MANSKPTAQQALILQALGEAAKIFMSNEKPGTEQVMPTEELQKVADTLDAQLGSRYKVMQEPADKFWYIHEQDEGRDWKSISRGYPHATSAYAALGRMVTQEMDTLEDLADGKTDTPDDKPE